MRYVLYKIYELLFKNQVMSYKLGILVVRAFSYFYQSSLGNEVDFRDIMNVSPNILAKH